MTARMHTALVKRSVRGTGLFLNRKRVHVCAECNGLFLSEIKVCNKTGLHNLIYLTGKGRQNILYISTGFINVEPQLRNLVKVSSVCNNLLG